MTMEEARANVDVDRHERGFRKIAWAFLKVMHLEIFSVMNNKWFIHYWRKKKICNNLFLHLGSLQLVGTNGVLNIDSKLRLQLFCPPPRGKRQENTIEVVDWWRRYPRSRYTSTLYITVKGLKLPDHVSRYCFEIILQKQVTGMSALAKLPLPPLWW